ncbi:MAG: amidohydrolase family protein [Streptosporangiaceae bacterium]
MTADAQLVIRGVTVVDPRDGSLRPGQDVRIAGDLIASVADGADVPGGTQVIDATGQYLVPGFNDMHAHPLGAGDPSGGLDLMLAHGITGFRQMSGSDRMLRDRATGTLVPAGAPRLLALPGTVLTPFNAGSAAAVVATVREQHELGADFIKAALVTSEVFYQAQRESRRLGIPVLGHLPNGIDVARASGDGVRSVEHLGPGLSLLACCSAQEQAVRDEVAASPAPRMPAIPPLIRPLLEPVFARMIGKLIINPVNRSRPADIAVLEHAASTFDQDAAAALAGRLARDGTWQVPTLIRSKTMHLCDDPAFRREPALRYMAPPTLKGWSQAAKKFSGFPAAARQTFRVGYDVMLSLTKILDEAGVPMLAGSDSGGAAWEVPGLALHQEFDELARAGLSPLRVLQLTTWNAAQFLDATDVMGTVAAGKHADLVLLDANPLESVDHLHRIRGVVRGGRYLGPADLDAVKEKVAATRSAR